MLINEELYDALKEANVSDETARKLAREAVKVGLARGDVNDLSDTRKVAKEAATDVSDTGEIVREIRRDLIVIRWMLVYVAVVATILVVKFFS